MSLSPAPLHAHRPSVVLTHFRKLPEGAINVLPTRPRPVVVDNRGAGPGAQARAGSARASLRASARRTTDTSSQDPSSAHVEDTGEPDALALQIHAVAARLAATSGAFAKAMDRLPDRWQDALQEKSLRHILRALADLPAARHVSGEQAHLRAALYDLTRAARAERLLLRKIAHHTAKQTVNDEPGALRETAGGGTLGLAMGWIGALDVGGNASATRSTSTTTFDDLTIARFTTRTVSGEAFAEAGVSAVVGLRAGLAAQTTRGPVRVDENMSDHVLGLARASVARRLGGPLLLRTLKRVFNPGRDRYAERISRAQAWQSRLPLERTAVTTVPMFHRAPPVPIEARMEAKSTTVGAKAGIGPAGVMVSGAREKTTVNIDLPLRLTGSGPEAARARQMPEIRQALHERLRPVLDRRVLRSPALELVRPLWQARGHVPRPQAYREAVARIAVEFEHLESLARLRIDAPGLAATPLASLSRDWCGAPASVETVMIRMLDTLAWLQSTPAPPASGITSPDLDTWTELQSEVSTLAARIHESTFPHDRREVHLGTHAFSELIQRIRSSKATLQGNVQWTALGVGARASVARIQRDDADPLRDGDWIELNFAADMTPSVDALLNQAQRALGESWGALPVDQVEQALTGLATGVSATGQMQWTLRLFRPSFQDDKDFPAHARGMHLHSVRLVAGGTLGVSRDRTLPVPLLPGVTAKVGLHGHRTEQVSQYERFITNTLTGALLRYTSRKSSLGDASLAWADVLSKHGADLDGLAKALADTSSVPACETRQLLKRHPDAAGSPGQQGPVELLDALSKTSLDRAGRRDALFALFEALGEGVQMVKKASPMRGPVMLPPSPLN